MDKNKIQGIKFLKVNNYDYDFYKIFCVLYIIKKKLSVNT